MKHVDIYTAGACSGNPGPGGWGAVLVYGERELELSDGEAHTTNNRMELTAAIRALEALREPCEVTLTTDSRYLCDGLEKKWAEGWRRRGWKKSDGSPALNPFAGSTRYRSHGYAVMRVTPTMNVATGLRSPRRKNSNKYRYARAISARGDR